jgi:pilus assembly protein CpaB
MLRIALILVALVAAGGAAWMSYANLSRGPATAEAPPAPVSEILVAKTDIELGQAVTAEMLAWREWPETLTHADYVRRGDRPDALTDYVGALARGRFVAGEPILP